MWFPSALLLVAVLVPRAFGQIDLKVISVPSDYKPTSSVSLVKPSSGYLRMFYRGPQFQLIQADLSESGAITNFVDLGGVLQSAPHAASTEHVSFVGQDLRVAIRVKNSGGLWSGPIYSGLRSEHQPNLHMETSSTGVTSLCLTVTALNNRVQSRCRIAGMWKPPSRTNTLTYGPSDGEFSRNFANKVRTGYGAVIPGVPRMTSRACFSVFVEGGDLLVGRSTKGDLLILHRFDYTDFKWEVRNQVSEWMSDAPDCQLSVYCVDIVYPQIDKFVRYQTCS